MSNVSGLTWYQSWCRSVWSSLKTTGWMRRASFASLDRTTLSNSSEVPLMQGKDPRSPGNTPEPQSVQTRATWLITLSTSVLCILVVYWKALIWNWFNCLIPHSHVSVEVLLVLWIYLQCSVVHAQGYLCFWKPAIKWIIHHVKPLQKEQNVAVNHFKHGC